MNVHGDIQDLRRALLGALLKLDDLEASVGKMVELSLGKRIDEMIDEACPSPVPEQCEYTRNESA